MADEKVKTPLWAKILLAVLPVLAVGLVTFIQYVFGAITTIEKQHVLMMERMRDIEDDRTKWATLAEHEKAFEALSTDAEVMRQVWEYHTGRQVPRPFPTRAGNPQLDPERLKKYWEQFQKQQMNRHAPAGKK